MQKFVIPDEASYSVPSLLTDCALVALSSFCLTCKRVKRVLLGLDESKSVRLDGVSPRVLRQCAGALSYPLFKLFRKILSATYPQSWKTSRVTPVHKRGSRSLPANYRPISVLSVLSSSFERAILPQLRRRLLQFIPPEQFGFVPGSGVSDAGILLADEIASALNDREELRVVSLDLRGAFDRVSCCFT